jgi:hypothetical protein
MSALSASAGMYVCYVLCQLMRHYGIPEKFIAIIRNTYTGMQSKVIHEGQLTEAFDIMTRVGQIFCCFQI